MAAGALAAESDAGGVAGRVGVVDGVASGMAVAGGVPALPLDVGAGGSAARRSQPDRTASDKTALAAMQKVVRMGW